MESLLLSAAGGVGGVVLAYWLLPVFLALAPSEIPRITEAAIDGRVLTVALGVTLITACAFGLAPALRLSRLSVIQAMKRVPGASAPRRARFRSGLVVIQVAASVTLSVLAGLVGQTFLTLLPADPGFASESRTVLHVFPREDLFPNRADRLHRWEELVRRVDALPGVTGVGMSSGPPFSADEPHGSVRNVDEASTADSAPLNADVRAISTNFFQLLQMPLVRGRAFTPADGAKAPGVAIVNETLARKLAPGGDVLGRSVRVSSYAALPAYEIVGVVADARSSGTTVDAWDETYVPHAQSAADFSFLIVRSELDHAALDKGLRQEIRAVFPGLPDNPAVMGATSMDALMRQAIAGPRFSATLVGAFSAMALLLAAIGLFGLVAYSVSQRQYELGIRAALGARPSDLVMTITRSAVALTTLGVALGLTTGTYLSRFVESQLYAIEPLDLPTFAGAATLMLLVAGVAAYMPARRAARTDPMTALRHD